MFGVRLGVLATLAVVLGSCSPTGPTPVESSGPTVFDASIKPDLPGLPAGSSQLEPDPSTAGSLTATTLPSSWLGFQPAVVSPAEGEFNPNGNWVHAQDAELIAREAFPSCSGALPPTAPQHALTGTYLNGQNQPGNAIALEFSTADDAHAWFDAFTSELPTCTLDTAGFTTREVTLSEDVLLGIRDFPGEAWTERVWLEDTIVRLMIVQGEFDATQRAAEPS